MLKIVSMNVLRIVTNVYIHLFNLIASTAIKVTLGSIVFLYLHISVFLI
jgi:hypothetical protein